MKNLAKVRATSNSLWWAINGPSTICCMYVCIVYWIVAIAEQGDKKLGEIEKIVFCQSLK